jgi:hypothetical protein
MPRYYFHLRYLDDDLVLDDEGQEFPDFAAARDEAVASICDFVADAIRRRAPLDVVAIEVADAAGMVVDHVHAQGIIDSALAPARRTISR